MYIDYNNWTYFAVLLTVVGVLLAGVMAMLTIEANPYPAESASSEQRRAAKIAYRKRVKLASLGIVAGAGVLVVAITTGISSTNENARKLQAAVKQTYGFNITGEQARVLNSPEILAGYPTIEISRKHDQGNIDTITYQMVKLETAANGRIKLVNVDAPYTRREATSEEFKRISS